MSVLLQAGDPGSVGNQNVTQGEFRDQIEAINDSIRQLAGRPVVERGDAAVNDPLNTPYILHVNQDIGKDTFVFKDPFDYSTQAGVKEADKDPMLRISQQRLVCGYTEARPFKTINRAIIEAAILTSRDYLDCCDALRTRVTICVTGEMLVYNNESGLDACNDYFSEAWTLSPGGLYEPRTLTDADGHEVSELYRFNPLDGGVLLPRGVSVVSLDLRKSIVRPNFVPCPGDEDKKQRNRRAIFKVTGEGYYYGFTFMDCPSYPSSHHLLDCFQFSSKDELHDFYLKVKLKLGEKMGVPLSDDLIKVSPQEYQIVGPNPDGNPTVSTDTTGSASPYVYNCSVRSEYGLCGIFCDGSRVDGFKSLVTAQFTGVSLQTDINAWEKYNPSSEIGDWWTYLASYQDLVQQSPDDVRQKKGWRSFHIRAINRAVIQEVSVFAIGQGVHHWVNSGGEITVTNSNSNFGGVACLAEGFNPRVASDDGPWTVKEIHRALDPFSKASNYGVIPLGVLKENQSDTATVLELQDDLFESQGYPGNPDVIRKRGYTFKEGDYIWVRNPYGHDYRAKLAKDAWKPTSPNQIRIQAPMTTDNASKNGKPGGVSSKGEALPNLAELQVFIRRFADTRDKSQRQWWIVLQDNPAYRIPYRDYVIRDVNDKWSEEYLSAVANSKRDRAEQRIEVTLRNCNVGESEAGHQTDVFYRRGDSVQRDGKHWVAKEEHMGDWDPNKWNEGYVHMEPDFIPEGQILNLAPKINFDGDSDESEDSQTCGFSLGSPLVKAQYESATDYKGLMNYLRVNKEIVCDLVPQPSESQDQAITPDEKINFHRPSNVRVFNHAWEWAGYLNYSKALPKYQQQISPTNKWTYYFTNVEGGKCYVSGFNEEGYQVTAKGLIDLATGAEIAGVDLGTPEQDIDRTEGGELALGPAFTNRSDRNPNEVGEPPFPSGYVFIADANSANPDLSKAEAKALNDKLDGDRLGVIKAPWLEEWVKGKGIVQSIANVSAVVIHVIPSGKFEDRIQGSGSVPYGFPSANGDGTILDDEEQWRSQGKPKTITEALRAAGRIYVPVGAEIVISLHGNLPAVEVGPLQLVNSYSPVVVATAQGLAAPAVVKLDRDTTINALKAFPEFNSQYSYSAGIRWCDVELQVNCRARGNQSLTFNGGMGMGKQGLEINLSNLKEMVLNEASFGQKTGFSHYPNATEQEWIRFQLEVLSVASDAEKPWVKIFGAQGDVDEGQGSGLTGHGVDLALDFRNPQYGRDDFCDLLWRFLNSSNKQIMLCYLGLGGRGGCRAGGRVGPTVDFDFGGEAKGNWNLKYWIQKTWLRNQNYFGRHFKVQDSGSNFKGVFNVSNAAYNSMEDVELNQGSCIDVDNETRWECGPFGVLKEWELQKGGTRIKAKADDGSYIYNGRSDRRD